MRFVHASVAAFAFLIPAVACAGVTPVNAIAGDASFVERFGRMPTALDDRDPSLRVRVHLEWVARRLRSERVRDPELCARRERLLEALDAYAAEGRFPVNRHYADRRPRFEDEEGRLCAVGQLIAASAGRELSHAIAARFEYDYLVDMDDPRLDAWIEWSGFSALELAMIQPKYGPDFARRAAAAYEQGRYDEALKNFERAYQVIPKPAFLFNIAACAERLGQYDRALKEYRRFLAQEPDTDRRVAAESRIAALEAKVRAQDEARARRPPRQPRPS